MANYKTWIFSGLSLLSLQFGLLEGFFDGDQSYEIELETGYRWDLVEQVSEIVDSAHVLPYTSFEDQYKNLSSVQLGGRAWVDYCDWVVKVAGHYGWIVDGSYDQDRIVKADTSRGHTWDALIGVGYTICLNDEISVVPLVGYSYDRQTVKYHHLHSLDPLDPTNVDHAQWNSSFYGAWVGVDFHYATTVWCWPVKLTTGYEFHYGQARTKLNDTLIVPADGDFAFSNKFNNMMGNVFRFDSQFNICGDWYVGLDAQYTFWGNAHKSHTSFLTGSGLAPTQSQDAFKLSWHSFAVLLNLSTVF